MVGFTTRELKSIARSGYGKGKLIRNKAEYQRTIAEIKMRESKNKKRKPRLNIYRLI